MFILWDLLLIQYWILIWIDLSSQSCMMFSRKLPSLLCFLSGGGMQLKMNTLIKISYFVDLGLRWSLFSWLAFLKSLSVKLGLFLLSFIYFQNSQVFPSACQTSKEVFSQTGRSNKGGYTWIKIKILFLFFCTWL